MKAIFNRFPFPLAVFFILSFLLLCGAPVQANNDKVEVFPKYFHPFSWEMDMKKLQSIFPRTKIMARKISVLVNGRKEEMNAVSLQGCKWDYLGKSPTEIIFDKGGKLQQVAVRAMGTKRIQATSYKKMLKIYGQLRQYFIRQYGNPADNVLASDDAQKYPPKSCKWSTLHFNLLLFVLADDKGFWALNLLVLRS